MTNTGRRCPPDRPAWGGPRLARAAWAVSLGLALGIGCAPGPKPATRKVAAAKSYPLVGIVRAVDEAAGVITIRHEAIPGYMNAMTMPFDVTGPADRELLKEVRAGDRVEATLRVDGDAAALSGLEIVDYAQAPTPEPAPKPEALRVGQRVPDFAMTTQDGETRTLASYRGQVVVLTFIYTRCPLPNFCPLMDRKFAQLAAQVGGVSARAGRVRLLSVSFDPEHDTPEILKAHAARMGARPPLWTYAVASHEELARAGPALGLTYGPAGGEVVHSLSTAVIGPDGRLARLELGGGWSPPELLAEITRLLRGAP